MCHLPGFRGYYAGHDHWKNNGRSLKDGKAVFENDVQTVWNVITDVKNYIWRTDLSKTEIISDKQFIEYTKNGYATTFTITLFEPYKRWEFDMENSNIKGHWIGIFTQKGEKTEIDFTEDVTAKKVLMKPFVRPI